MAYRDNVQDLCDRLKIKNPIEEQDLLILRVIFTISDRPHEVAATPMNRAGRLFLESRASGVTKLHLRHLRADAEKFFTSELWDTCTTTNRSLVFGIKMGDEAEIFYKL